MSKKNFKLKKAFLGSPINFPKQVFQEKMPKWAIIQIFTPQKTIQTSWSVAKACKHEPWDDKHLQDISLVLGFLGYSK